jgi:hypothetical protein
MRMNRIQVQPFPTVRYEPPILRDQFDFDPFTCMQQLRVQMLADYPIVTQATTRRKQIAAACELIRKHNDPGNSHLTGLARSSTVSVDLQSMVRIGDCTNYSSRQSGLQFFPQMSGTGSRQS